MNRRVLWVLVVALAFAVLPAWAQSPEGLAVSGWTRLGLAGEDFSSVSSDPNDASLLFAGGGPNGGNGMFRSTDGGTVWTPVNTGLGTIQRVNTIAVEPPAPTLTESAGLRNELLGTPPVVLIGVLPTGGLNLFRSTDLGDSWSVATTGLPSTGEVTSIVFDPTDPLIVYASLNSGGVAVSGDGGASWRDESTGLGTDCGGLPCVLDLVIDPVTPTTLYAALPPDQDVFKSTDGAASWTPTGAGIFAEYAAIDPANPQTLLVSASLTGLIKTTDGGDTWDDLSANPGLPSGASHRSVALGPQSGEIWLVAESVDGELVYRSLDSGQTWAVADFGLEGLRVRDLHVAGGAVLAATDDGVYRYLDVIFSDGFESGDTTIWSASVGEN